jgi:hypothetical protein
MSLPKGRFTLAEPPSGDGDHLPHAANFKAEHLLLLVLLEEFFDSAGDFFPMRFERKMARIQ